MNEQNFGLSYWVILSMINFSPLFSWNYSQWYSLKEKGDKILICLRLLPPLLTGSIHHPLHVHYFQFSVGLHEKSQCGVRRRVKTSHPRIALGQQYPMPCLEWSGEEVEWEQGSSWYSVRHRGEYPNVMRYISGLRWLILVIEGFEGWGQIWGVGLNRGLEGWSEVERADLRSWGQI